MMSALIALVILFAIILLWLDGARARELAVGIATELCRRRGFQLLDETVSLSRMALRRTTDGLRFRRMFRFDYSVEGVGRRTGHLILLGIRLEHVDLGLDLGLDEDAPNGPPTRETAENPAEHNNKGNTVVPFRRRE
jgi:hypothetical protein